MITLSNILKNVLSQRSLYNNIVAQEEGFWHTLAHDLLVKDNYFEQAFNSLLVKQIGWNNSELDA